jgi:hypothetical protein
MPMRFLPEQTVQCHVCGSSYPVKSHFDATSGTVASEPSACPACDAPRKTVPARTPGLAKSLVLTLAGVRWYVDRFGDAARFLEQHSLLAQDVDAYLALVDALDFAAWEADERAVEKPTADERETLAALPRLRAEAASGQLRETLMKIAEPVKVALRAEYSRSKAIFDRRKAPPTPVSSVDWAHGEPVGWRTLLETGPESDEAQNRLLGVQRLTPKDLVMPAEALGKYASWLPSSIVHFGVAKTRAIVEPALPHVPAAIARLARGSFAADPLGALHFLEFVSGLECAGIPFAEPMAGAPMDKWLKSIATKQKTMIEKDRVRAALLCLAFGVTRPILEVLHLKPLAKFKPDLEFSDRWDHFARYLALAVDKGVSAKDVQPAWESMVWSFPTLLTKSLVYWDSLLLAARVYYGLFEKRPVGEVGQALFDVIRAK